MQRNMDHLLQRAIPLIAEDLKSCRRRLGITSASAAKRAGVSWTRYRRLETGQVSRSRQSLAAMTRVAERLGLEAVRMSFVDFLGQYMQVVLPQDIPPTVFIDTLDSDVAELKGRGQVNSMAVRCPIGAQRILAPRLVSRKRSNSIRWR